MTNRFDVIIWDKVPQKGTDEMKTIARRVGNAKTEENGNITLFIADGISISGRVSLTPWGSKDSEEE